MRLCRLLGAVKKYSKQIPQWILEDAMNIVPRRINRPLTDEEGRGSVLQREMGNFIEIVRWRYGDKLKHLRKLRRSPKMTTNIQTSSVKRMKRRNLGS